jgi:hypothetical protein
MDSISPRQRLKSADRINSRLTTATLQLKGDHASVRCISRKNLKPVPYVVAAVFYVAIAAWVSHHATGLDYAAYLIGAQGFIAGQDVYSWRFEDFQAAARNLNIPHFAYPYRYSPVSALLIAPLLALPYKTGLFLWSLLNAVAVIASGEALSRLCLSETRRWIIRLSVWFFVPFGVSLYAGQVNPLTTLFGALAFLAIHQARDRVAGAWTALAFLIKPIAVGLLCYPIWKGRWRPVIVFAGITAAVLSLMTALFGWGSLHSGVPLSITGLEVDAYPPLQNFWGLAQRWFTTHQYGASVALNPQLARQAGLALSLILAIATLLVCLPPLRRNTWRDADLGLVLIAVALTTPATWYHHYALLAIPLAIQVANGERLRDAALAFTAWVAINFFGAAWHFLVGYTLLLDLGTLGALLLWTGLAGISVRQRRRVEPRDAVANRRL